jgi:uncharacterized protein YicC (UPF0701 family)
MADLIEQRLIVVVAEVEKVQSMMPDVLACQKDKNRTKFSEAQIE